jgi:broad specificity phosphatase PhoE
MIKTLLAVVLVAATAAGAAAQPVVFVVRHAERADAGTGGMGSDPSLSAEGRARAERLAAMLKDVGLTAVFTTDYKRTKETAAPTATAHHLTLTEIKATDTARLVERVKRATGSVLIVGHSNTVTDVLKALGAATAPEVSDAEFDNLFILTPGSHDVIRLRY